MNRAGLYALALLVLAADQCAKHWVLWSHFHWPEQGREIIPGFFALTFSVNTGGAFGILPHGTLLLAGAAGFAALAIILYSIRVQGHMPRLLSVALALPLGGALGNMWDRITRGYVIDFLDFHAGSGPSWHFPIFNLADSAICIGVGLLALIGSRQQVTRPEPAAMLKEKP